MRAIREHPHGQAYGRQLLDGDIDVADAAAAAAEGERDPRCLLRAFECVREAAALYSTTPDPSTATGAPGQQASVDQGATPAPLDAVFAADATEVLFDVLTWYFPISFTPPPVNKVRLCDTQRYTMALSEVFRRFFFAPLTVNRLHKLLMKHSSTRL